MPGSPGGARAPLEVETVSLNGASLFPSRVIEADMTVQEEFEGAPEHLRSTTWLNPLWGESTRS